MLDQENVAQASISFSIAVLTLVGFLFWISYTAYGLSAFPISIIKGRKHMGEDVSDVQTQMEKIRSEQQQIESKYLGGKKMSKTDEAKLRALERRETALSRQGERLQQTQSGWRHVVAILRPFFFIFGIVFFLLTLLIMVSVVLTNVDKAMNSDNLCGSSCGFVLAYPQIMNPLDSLLTLLSKYFPIDYIVFGALVMYIFFASLSGVVQIGIRFLWINLYKIHKGASPPQGLLLAAVVLMLCILTLNMEVTTIAPQYANFGNQVFYNTTSNQTEPCNFNAPSGNCTMTQIGEFVNRILLRTNFFGVVYFYATWIFVATFLIGIVIAGCRARSSNLERRENDSDEDEDTPIPANARRTSYKSGSYKSSSINKSSSFKKDAETRQPLLGSGSSV